MVGSLSITRDVRWPPVNRRRGPGETWAWILAVSPGLELGAAPTAPAATASAIPGGSSGPRLDRSGRPDRMAKTLLGGGRLVRGRPHRRRVLRGQPTRFTAAASTCSGRPLLPGLGIVLAVTEMFSPAAQMFICRFRLAHERRLSPVLSDSARAGDWKRWALAVVNVPLGASALAPGLLFLGDIRRSGLVGAVSAPGVAGNLIHSRLRRPAGCGGLRHVGGAVHPVGDRRPVLLGYGLDDIPQAGVLADAAAVIGRRCPVVIERRGTDVPGPAASPATGCSGSYLAARLPAFRAAVWGLPFTEPLSYRPHRPYLGRRAG